MKVKSVLFSELHGSVSKPFHKDMGTCRCKGPGQIILEKRPIPTGPKSELQLQRQVMWHDLARHWKYLNPELRANFQWLADFHEISLYNAFMKTVYASSIESHKPQRDVTVYVTYPNENFDWWDEVALERFDTYEKRIFVKWQEDDWTTDPLPILAEVLCWFNDNHMYPARGQRVDCWNLLDDWAEDTITWNNKPGLRAMQSYLTLPPMNNYYCFDVTADVLKSIVDDDTYHLGYCLKFNQTVHEQGGTVWMDDKKLETDLCIKLRLYY